MTGVRSWSLLLLGGLLLGACKGPSCEEACARVFGECAFKPLTPGIEVEEAEASCVSACMADMRSYAGEPDAVGWVACVGEFSCDPEDDGVPLCLACQAGYYNGQTTGTACRYEDGVSRY